MHKVTRGVLEQRAIVRNRFFPFFVTHGKALVFITRCKGPHVIESPDHSTNPPSKASATISDGKERSTAYSETFRPEKETVDDSYEARSKPKDESPKEPVYKSLVNIDDLSIGAKSSLSIFQ